MLVRQYRQHLLVMVSQEGRVHLQLRMRAKDNSSANKTTSEHLR